MEKAMLEVKLERVPYGVSEKKVLNPTVKMLEFALSNAGFSEGTWVLKSPHRTRKKGAERFRAMRLEGAGIRVRTKPGGNDTCYEWTIFPPQGMDQDAIFSDLCSLHPTSMRSTRSMAETGEGGIMGSLFDRITDSKPGLLTDDLAVKKHSNFFKPNTDEIQSDLEEFATDLEGVTSVAQISEGLAHAMERIESLDISETGETLSSDFAVDRALIAFEISGGGTDFVRRTVLSEGLVKLLNIEGLSKKSAMYGSVKGAMRVLLMSCCGKGYMERIMYGENSTNGYRLTEEGKKRLALLDTLVSEELKSRPVKQKHAEAKPAVVASPKDVGNAISVLKGLIGEHEAVKKQMEDLAVLIEELEIESENEGHMLVGVENSLANKVSERDALDAEIGRLRSKLSGLKVGGEKKAADMGALKEEMDKLSAKKAEIESRLTSRG